MNLTAPLPQKIIDQILATILGQTLSFIDDNVVAVFGELARRHGLTPRDGSQACWTFAVQGPRGQFGFDLRTDLSIAVRTQKHGGVMAAEIQALELRLSALRHEWMIVPLDPDERLSTLKVVPPTRQRPSSLAERAA